MEFLDEGNKVKVSVRFRGREASHAEIGHALIKQIIGMVGAAGIVEQMPKMEGKILSLIFAPGPKVPVKKPAPAPAAKPAEAPKTAAPKAAAGAGKSDG